jgi:cell shape-determining protein MreC
MKANFPPKNRLGNPYLKRALILFTIFICGAVIFSLFESAIISFASPIWQRGSALTRSLERGLAFLDSHEALVQENFMLKEKLASLEITLQSLESRAAYALDENILAALAGRSQGSNLVVAAVLTYPPQTPYDVLIIDAGSNDSLRVGSEVSLAEGPLLGAVSEVFSNKAKVKLFSSSGFESNAVLERNSLPVILVGTGAGNFKIKLARDIEVEKGDRIVSRDLDPRLLAVVEEIKAEPTDSFKEILARSPANIFVLRLVVVKP